MTIEQLNQLDKEQQKLELTKCCGSSFWVAGMMKVFPVASLDELLEQALKVWAKVSDEDALEAFLHHPKIGDVNSLKAKYANTLDMAAGEQSGVNIATQQVVEQLAEGNSLYEEKFGYIFIVCATGKSAEEMLALLLQRLPNEPAKELEIAKAEQMKITAIRLNKLIAS